MAYKRKTCDEFQIHGDYGEGFEELHAEDSRKEALKILRQYRENQPGIPFKLVVARIPLARE